MALMDIEELDAEVVARKSMKIAGDMCVYTNNNLTVEILNITKPAEEGSAPATTPVPPAI
jgi:ATP-dependent HslUV protease, peptidase subunit HslV